MSEGIETSFGTICPGHFYPSEVRHKIVAGPKFLYALFNPADKMYEVSKALVTFIENSDLPYNRIIVNDHIIDEAATRLKKKVSHRNAETFLSTIRDSQYFRFKSTPEPVFTRATEKFSDWDDLDASMTDFIIAAHMDELDISYIATYDGHFGTFNVVPIPYLD